MREVYRVSCGSTGRAWSRPGRNDEERMQTACPVPAAFNLRVQHRMGLPLLPRRARNAARSDAQRLGAPGPAE
jgi:hypothetical protein